MARKNKKSRDYWRDREIEHAKSSLKDENKVKRKMAVLYRDTGREIEKEVNTMLGNYADKNGLSLADVKKEVSTTDIRDYENKAARYVKEKNFSKKANKEMAIYNLKMRVSRLELIMSHVDLELIALTDGLDELIYDQVLQVGLEEVARQAGILGESINVNKKDIEFIAKRQFHGDDFSNRLWKNKRLLHSELKKRLTEQATKGQNPRDAARKLRQEVEQSVYNSERIMITESARVQSESQLESFKQAGFEEYEFITTEGACDICLPMDGEIFRVKDGMPGKNMSPMHPFCKCSNAAHMSREAWGADLKARGL